MEIARRAGLVVLAIAAGWVWFNLEPLPIVPTLSGTEINRLVGLALSDSEANEALADSAPQQQVVNGWVARDLLQILVSAQAAQLDTLAQVDARQDERVPALIGLLAVAFCWWGLFSPSRRREPMSPVTSRHLQPDT